MSVEDRRREDFSRGLVSPASRPRRAIDLFFPTRDHRFIVYTSEVEAGGGLFVTYVH